MYFILIWFYAILFGNKFLVLVEKEGKPGYNVFPKILINNQANNRLMNLKRTNQMLYEPNSELFEHNWIASW